MEISLFKIIDFFSVKNAILNIPSFNMLRNGDSPPFQFEYELVGTPFKYNFYLSYKREWVSYWEYSYTGTTFQYVYDNIPPHIQNEFIYYLDIFLCCNN